MPKEPYELSSCASQIPEYLSRHRISSSSLQCAIYGTQLSKSDYSKWDTKIHTEIYIHIYPPCNLAQWDCISGFKRLVLRFLKLPLHVACEIYFGSDTAWFLGMNISALRSWSKAFWREETSDAYLWSEVVHRLVGSLKSPSRAGAYLKGFWNTGSGLVSCARDLVRMC